MTNILYLITYCFRLLRQYHRRILATFELYILRCLQCILRIRENNLYYINLYQNALLPAEVTDSSQIDGYDTACITGVIGVSLKKWQRALPITLMNTSTLPTVKPISTTTLLSVFNETVEKKITGYQW